jgi:RND superfamily putative drug exporter
MMIESDHDMRNPADMIVLDRIAKSLFRIRGIAEVQSITRPLGSPIAHSSIPYQVSMSSVPLHRTSSSCGAGRRHRQDVRQPGRHGYFDDRMQALMSRLADSMHDTVGSADGMVARRTRGWRT